MRWDEALFIKKAKFYATILESMWENGKSGAKSIADFLAEKGLKEAKVLDVPCGIGRVSIPMARLGYSVTGIDISPTFIKIAKEKARQFRVGRRTSFVVGRMKEVDTLFGRGSFDVAINVFTSIGFGKERDDQEFFKSVGRVVKDDGFFIIAGLANRDYITSHFTQNLYDETEGLVLLHKNKLNSDHSRIISSWRFFIKSGKSLRFAGESPVNLRLYSPQEVAGMLKEAGWKPTATYDSLAHRMPVSSESRSFTIVAELA